MGGGKYISTSALPTGEKWPSCLPLTMKSVYFTIITIIIFNNFLWYLNSDHNNKHLIGTVNNVAAGWHINKGTWPKQSHTQCMPSVFLFGSSFLALFSFSKLHTVCSWSLYLLFCNLLECSQVHFHIQIYTMYHAHWSRYWRSLNFESKHGLAKKCRTHDH